MLNWLSHWDSPNFNLFNLWCWEKARNYSSQNSLFWITSDIVGGREHRSSWEVMAAEGIGFSNSCTSFHSDEVDWTAVWPSCKLGNTEAFSLPATHSSTSGWNHQWLFCQPCDYSRPALTFYSPCSSHTCVSPDPFINCLYPSNSSRVSEFMAKPWLTYSELHIWKTQIPFQLLKWRQHGDSFPLW